MTVQPPSSVNGLGCMPSHARCWHAARYWHCGRTYVLYTYRHTLVLKQSDTVYMYVHTYASHYISLYHLHFTTTPSPHTPHYTTHTCTPYQLYHAILTHPTLTHYSALLLPHTLLHSPGTSLHSRCTSLPSPPYSHLL